MIEEKTLIHEITWTRNGGGHVQVRFAIVQYKDGIEMPNPRNHRIALPPGANIDDALAAIDANITTDPRLLAPAIDRERVPLLKGICDLAHTPDVVEKYRADLLKAQSDFAAGKKS